MNYKWLEDLSVFKVNRLENKAYKRQYRNEEERLVKETSFKRSLNGAWKFEFATTVASCNKEFFKEEYDCSNWDEIQVPGHFSMQGYGHAYYLNHVYTWSGGPEQLLPAQLPTKNDVGSYVKEVELSQEDLNEKVEICFEGVESAFALWVNGQFIGYSEDSYSPSYFDISNAVRVGKNKFAVQVFRFCSGSWLEGQDYFRMCGIFRDIDLVFVPKTHLLDLTVRTPLFDNYTKANVNVDLEFEGSFENAKAILKLIDKNNNLVETKEIEAVEKTAVTFELDQPDLWNSEHPDLYTLLVEVYNDGKLLEITDQKVGIREFCIRDSIMYINGKRIVFHGVNRHEFCAKSGRTVSYEDTLEDIQIMKANNINALRTSHYPNAEYVYELCDEYGLYCCDEANVESHGSWNEWWDMDNVVPHNKMEWLPPVIDRANSMYQRDKNHSSIVMWSIGNESYGGRVLFEESQFLRNIDPTRVIQYESLEYEEMYSGTREYPDTSDVESQMYIPAAKIEKFIKERPGKPYILCEYSHSMGNSTGGLIKYTELEKKYPTYQGGFIWDWIDQAQIDKKGNLRYGGDLKERPSDYEFCGNGLLFADRTVTPKMQEVKYCFQYVDMEMDPKQIKVTNNYLFSNLDEYKFTIELNKNGQTVDKKDVAITCDPGESVVVDNPFTVECNEDQYDVIMRVCNQTGHEVAHEQLVYEKKAATKEVVDIPMRYSEDFLNIGIHSEDYSIIFAKNKGLVSYEVHGEQLIRMAPKPNFFRAQTNNDYNNGYARRYGQWLLASLYSGTRFVKVEKEPTVCKLYYEYELPNLGEEKVKVVYTVTGDGTIDVDMSYNPSEENVAMPAFGMMFSFYNELTHVNYFGMGPDENHIDRNYGALLGNYEYDVVANMTPYLWPQECGNRTGTQKVVLSGNEIAPRVTFETDGFEFSALPYTPFEIENARHRDELSKHYQTILCLYSKQMGVGGDDSWGLPVLDEYLLSNKEKQHLHFSFKAE